MTAALLWGLHVECPKENPINETHLLFWWPRKGLMPHIIPRKRSQRLLGGHPELCRSSNGLPRSYGSLRRWVNVALSGWEDIELSWSSRSPSEMMQREIKRFMPLLLLQSATIWLAVTGQSSASYTQIGSDLTHPTGLTGNACINYLPRSAIRN